MPKRNQFDDKNNLNEEILAALQAIAEGQERLNDNMEAIGQNIYRQDVQELPSLPQGGTGTSLAGGINQAAGLAAKNPLTGLASSLLNFQKAVDGAANTLGSVLTDNFNLRGQYNVGQTAQQQTAALVGQRAAFGYETSDAETADLYLQFREIEQRRFRAQRQAERLTTRGSFLFGAIPGAAEAGFDIESALQQVYNLGFKSEDTLDNELKSLAKTRDQAMMQKEINKNNAVSDQGGY